MTKILNRNVLKYIAICAMFLDHFAAIFVPMTNPLYYVLRIIGRLTMPIMCYFLVEGYIHTSSKGKYGIRLLTFALISQIPYTLALYGELISFNLNVMFTLFLSFLTLLTYDKIKNPILKFIIILALIMLSIFTDWKLMAPLWVLSFYILKDKPTYKLLSFIVIFFSITAITILSFIKAGEFTNQVIYDSLIQLGVFLTIPLYLLYNNEPGKKTPFSKWFFYIFYPAHLIILWGINALI